MHGGKSPGAPHGMDNGNYKTGYWTKEAIENRRQIGQLIRDSRECLNFSNYGGFS
jgi:hypothetical protein